MSDAPTIFISYSHQDEDWKDLVVGHLRVAERQGDFLVWDDRRIDGGDDWRREIDQALAAADIGVLLISRHFLTSNFIMDHEVERLLERKARGRKGFGSIRSCSAAAPGRRSTGWSG